MASFDLHNGEVINFAYDRRLSHAVVRYPGEGYVLFTNEELQWLINTTAEGSLSCFVDEPASCETFWSATIVPGILGSNLDLGLWVPRLDRQHHGEMVTSVTVVTCTGSYTIRTIGEQPIVRVKPSKLLATLKQHMASLEQRVPEMYMAAGRPVPEPLTAEQRQELLARP